MSYGRRCVLVAAGFVAACCVLVDSTHADQVTFIGGGNDSYNNAPVVLNGNLYLQGRTTLLKYDGTTVSTPPVEGAPGDCAVFNGALYMSNPVPSATQLVSFDGTQNHLYSVSSGNPPYQGFTVWNNNLYFTSQDSLYRFDGTSVTRVTAGAYDRIVQFDGSIFYSGYNGNSYGIGFDTGTFTGVSTSLAFGGLTRDLTVFNGAIYFAGLLGGTATEELWKYDPFSNAYSQATHINSSSAAIDITGTDPNFVAYNGSLYFTANDGVHGKELWKFDGTTASMVIDATPGAVGSGATPLFVHDGELYLEQFNQLWKTDGTTETFVANGTFYGETDWNGSAYLTGRYVVPGNPELGFFLLTVPEPSSFELGLVGIIGLAAVRFARWRRKSPPEICLVQP